MLDRIEKAVQEAVQSEYGEEFAPEVFPTENPAHGHYSTNVAMKLAKARNGDPMRIAEGIKCKVEGIKLFERVEVAAPGFINFWLSKEALEGELTTILEHGERYGRGDALKDKKIIVEYTDPNPFKEFHIGHLYTNMIGESLARLFEAQGADVRRANYQGDVGIHVAKAIWGMKQKLEIRNEKLKDLEAQPLKERINFMGQAYAAGATAFEEDETVKQEITDLNKKIYDLDTDVQELYQKGRAWSLEYFETIYRRLGTKFDFYYFESEVGQIGLALVKENIQKGIFEESEGAIVFPGEKYGLHRRVFVNSRGLPTYEAKDLGLVSIKYKDFPYDASVSVTGNEITDYFKVIIAALRQIHPDLARKIKHIAHGMVRFAEGKMSSRTGNVVTAEGLLDEVKKRARLRMASAVTNASADRSDGQARSILPEQEKEEVLEAVTIGAVKYAFLKSRVGQDIVFDPDRSLDLKGDSGPYLQYAYARLSSVMSKSGEAPPKTIDLGMLEKGEEERLIRQLMYFPETVGRAAELYEPNIVAEYLYKLANAANSFYEHAPILKAEEHVKENRLALAVATMAVLKSGLRLLGMQAPERM
ncbi:arginine--tRNA ligase [Candidatus Wolfebacteria bacterium]|nr:arginine--tRNA ligase [Candidatus Wolfebacteria bacterium]